MSGEVYIDLYFFINASMDLLCLLLSGRLLHFGVKRWRLILASGIGGLYAVTALLSGLSGIFGFLCDLAAAFLLCSVAFAQKQTGLGALFKMTAVEFLASAIFGGILTVLYAGLNRLDLPIASLSGDGASVWIFAILCAAAGAIASFGGKLFGFSSRERTAVLDVSLFGKQIRLSALFDSGNLLRDPIGGRSVVIADTEKLLPLLPKDLASAIKGGFPSHLTSVGAAYRIRLIPTETASGKVLLPAVLPDRMTVTLRKECYPVNYLLAFSDLHFSAEGFDALLPTE